MPPEQPQSYVEPKIEVQQPLYHERAPMDQEPVYQQQETTDGETEGYDEKLQEEFAAQESMDRQVIEPRIKPQVLSDNLVDRMAHDPEVRTNKRKFIIGLISVSTLVIMTILGSQFHWWSAISENMAGLSQKMLAKGKVESRDEVVAEAAKKAIKDGTKSNVIIPVTPITPAGNVSERDQAQAAVAAFLNAKDLSARLELVRDRSRTEKMMRDYYSREKDGPIAFERVEEVEINPEGENTFAYLLTLSTGEKRRMLLGKASNGQYLVDWASFVLYGQMSWEEFMEKKPETPVLMRVLATSDAHYTEEFSDKNRFGCLKLTHPSYDKAPPIYAYFTSSSTLGRSLSFVMRSSFDPAVPITLTLKYPSNSKANNQVWVDEMVTQGWVTRGR